MSIGDDLAVDVHELIGVVHDLQKKNSQLEFALSSRVLIEQAKGILAERYRLDMDRAFEVLRGAARTNRIRIHVLADQVVSSPRTPTVIELELLQRRRAAAVR